MVNNEDSINLIHTSVFQIYLLDTFTTVFESPAQAKFKNSNIFIVGSKLTDWYTKESLCTLYYIMNKLHLISTKVITSRTFVNKFANFNPRIQI